ncbi:MAG: hypothetical protein AAF433_14615 [Bacteroidota bacterium]
MSDLNSMGLALASGTNSESETLYSCQPAHQSTDLPLGMNEQEYAEFKISTRQSAEVSEFFMHYRNSLYQSYAKSI